MKRARTRSAQSDLALAMLLIGTLGCGEVMGGAQDDGGGADAAVDAAGVQSAIFAEGAEAAADGAFFEGLAKAQPAGGVGEMVAGQGDDSARLELAALRVDARLAGDVVAVEVEHVFHNPTDQQLEGTFRFPMPQRAILTGLALQIGDKLVEGELVERNKARKTYEAIVDAMRDPALLEWEAGNVFKLRVFPIEAKGDKRVVLRYLAPLDRSAAGLRFVYATAAPGMAGRIGHFRLRFDGDVVSEGREVVPGEDVIVTVGRGLPVVPVVYQESRPDGTYTAVSLRPDWRQVTATLGAEDPKPARRVAILLDTSRSALEHKKLALDTLRGVLSGVGEADRFMLLASDLGCTRLTDSWRAAGAVDGAMAAAEAWDFDGASDLGGALDCALSALAEPANAGVDQLVYIGDGVPTWGQIDARGLVNSRAASLEGIEPHAALLGRGADDDIFRRLADRLGGRVARLRTADDAAAFGRAVARASITPRLRQAFVRFEGGDPRPTLALGTLFAGDGRTVLIHTPIHQTPPTAMTLLGRSGWSGHLDRVDLSSPVPAEHVATRWARQQIGEMERAGVAAEHIVRASLDWGVMSRHTSLLVLENDEAWRQHGIERRKQAAQPRVSGGDLESLAGGPSLSPDRIQPGDPEIRIPAPADARSVTVILPWGETLDARYERDDAGQGAWVARFLVDKETADGLYRVLIRVTHRDGAVELLHLPFAIDTKAPTVRVRVRPKRGAAGTWQVRVQQVITSHELSLVSPQPQPRARSWKKKARIAADAKGVEVRFPDGQIVPLIAIRKGFVRGDWTPTAAFEWPLQLEVFAIDTALNQVASRIAVDRPGSRP